MSAPPVLLSGTARDVLAALSSPDATPIIDRIARRIVEMLTAERDATTSDEDLLDVEQTASLLGITTADVYQRRHRGTLQAVKIGRSIRFRRGDLLGRPRT